MSRNSNLVIALVFAAAGCGAGQDKAQQGGVVVAKQETRSSSSPAAAGEAKAECKQEAMDPAIADAKAALERKDYAAATQKLEALTSEQPDNAKAWMMYAYTVHSAGDLDRALELHQKAATFEKVRATALYNVACVHALKGDSDAAFAALDQAIAAGFHHAEHLEKDADLASLRSDARFAQMMSAAEAKHASAEQSGEWSECDKQKAAKKAAMQRD
jgi:Flp pilus assembly protein TadD